MFSGRNLLIATKHKKETVIAPILEKGLDVNCFVILDLDTDKLGTFTGEIERKDDPLMTARKKCELAMKMTNCDLVIASEGSFGPHPSIYFAPADDELLLFIDRKNNLEISAREISMKTNYSAREIVTWESLQEFAKSTLFPTHGLILRKSKNSNQDIIKGITTARELQNAYNRLIHKHGSVYVETDMRALYNPTRMQVIETTAKKLVDKIMTACPRCNAPGFSVTASKPGLKCENCGLPTRSTLCHVMSCQSCGFLAEEMHPHGRFSEDPMYCDFCNP